MAAGATDALGAEPGGAGAGLVLAGNGAWGDFLPALLGRLRPVPGHFTVQVSQGGLGVRLIPQVPLSRGRMRVHVGRDSTGA